MDSVRLAGKIALVTGGSRGIGKAIALRLAREGADVIINYKQDAAAAEEAAAEVRGFGRRAWAFQADMRKPEEIKRLCAEIKKEVGDLGILVHNAAFGTMAPTMRMGRASWQATFDTNVTALLLLSQGVYPLLKKSGGHIVAISSVGSFTCFSEYAAIGSSKAAMEALVRYLAFDLAREGIRANTVSAGPVDTRAVTWFKYPNAVWNFGTKKSPLGRMGMPEDLAGIVAFLCTPDADWIVGQTIVADGGIMLGVEFKDWL
ncbi:SDR family oxidoreductase [Myxococcota bacterium]|nr:SDR family oxidoreductase [Myxococcota bacterium]